MREEQEIARVINQYMNQLLRIAGSYLKNAQSRTTMMVEYELKDAEGNVYEDYLLWEDNLWKGFDENYRVVHGGPRQIAPNRENGHQRCLLIYDRGSGINFAEKIGEKQIAHFQTNDVLMDGKEKALHFPELEFVIDNVFEGKGFTYDQPLVVNDIPIYLGDICYEGVILRVEVLTPAYLGLDHINSDLYVEIATDTMEVADDVGGWPHEVLELEQEGGTKYRRDEYMYVLDMFESKELRITPVMRIGADWDTAEYIYGEEVVISLE